MSSHSLDSNSDCEMEAGNTSSSTVSILDRLTAPIGQETEGHCLWSQLNWGIMGNKSERYRAILEEFPKSIFKSIIARAPVPEPVYTYVGLKA